MGPRSLILDRRRRAVCPVCRNRVQYGWYARPGEDVVDLPIPVHSEGLIGSGRRCYAAGLSGEEAQQMGDDRDDDPRLPLRAHP